jgi:hypothetical protein
MMLPGLLLVFAVSIGPATLWSGEVISDERIAAATPQGLELRQRFDAGSIDGRALVPWGEVKSIANGWSGAESYREVADAVYRAEERLARGDAAGAGWLLEPLSRTYFQERGATTSQIASALVMVRVLDGRTGGAVDAWLVWRQDRGGPGRAWLDPVTGLCPSLPPVFVEAVAAEILRGDPSESDVMRSIYRAAAAAGSDSEGDMLASVDRSARDRADVGVRMVWDMVRARTDSDASVRRAARESLDRKGRGTESGWLGTWAELGVGVSLLGEADAGTRDAGAARLIAVIVEYSRAAPGLTSLARDLLVDYFEETGRAGHAESVRGMDRAALIGFSAGIGEDRDGTSGESRGVPAGENTLENP